MGEASVMPDLKIRMMSTRGLLAESTDFTLRFV